MKKVTFLSLEENLFLICIAIYLFSIPGAMAQHNKFVHTSGGNPYLPLWKCLPDGEPCVFEDPDHPGEYRAYIIGSHDLRFTSYCAPDIRIWPASVVDLTQWRDEDPVFTHEVNGQWNVMYAPELVEVKRRDGTNEYYLSPYSHGLHREEMVDKGVPFSTICNPVDLSYRFGLGGSFFREAADPSMIQFKGEYYLFLSKSGGYFHSNNLIDWNLITTDDLPIEEYAPTVEEIDGYVYFTTSVGTNRIYRSADPGSGRWELVTDKFPYIFNDPMIYYDKDTDRVYLYHGSGAGTPLMGMELDKETFMPKGEEIPLFRENRDKYGWEVAGDYNTRYEATPWLEGAWMNKHDGKYYMQYAIPGTEFKSYCDGVYVSDNPLGPFRLMKHNPFAYKPEGFAGGAGHGSTFQDVYGNYWHFGTVSISVRHMFERRLSLFPTFFDEDGEMYAYTGWGDYPIIVPEHKVTSPGELFPDWMLLSYNKKVVASSALDDHPATNAVNEDIRTWWSAETGNKGESFSIDLGERSSVYAIQVNFADQDAHQSGRSDSIYYQYYIEGSQDGNRWEMIVDKSSNRVDSPHDYTQLEKSVTIRYIRITNVHVPSGKFSISGFRVFGKADKAVPDVTEFTGLTRSKENRRSIGLTWDQVENATGYNIRFGTDKDKLYHNYLVYESNELDINILSADQTYFFSIDSFNEGGITKGTKVEVVP